MLKVGSSSNSKHASDIEHGRAGLLAVLWGSIVAAVFAVVVQTQVLAADVAQTFRIGRRGSVSGYDFFLSFALLGIGHLVGLSVGIAMLIGALIGWGWGVPHFSAMSGDITTAAATLAQKTWSIKVRFIGAGAIGVSAIWTLLKLVKPVTRGLAGAMAASRARKAGRADTLPITERDIPIGIVGLVTLICMLPIAWLLGYFGNSSGLGAHLPTLIIGGVAYVVLMSFFVSAVCGYMAGLIGSSNSPLSGIGILVVIGAALLLVIGVKPYVRPDASKALMAFALFTTAVIFNVAAIANNNLQDLKTGQLVDATPWKQQVALIFGVIAGAFVIPPVLDLVNHAYGFVGAPGAELRPHPLPAPQAGLISSLAQGVIAADIDWSLIRIGGMIGIGIILLDEILARTTKHMRVPPLAVGLGIYLPTQSTLMIVVGAIAGWLFDRRADRTPKPEATKQLGVLLASGLIVGEGIIGVVISAIIVFSGKDAPLALVGPGFETRWQDHRRCCVCGNCLWALSLDSANGNGKVSMKRKWNWPIWIGFVVAVGGLFSYEFFAQFPITRDFPWANLLLFGIGAALLIGGLFRAFGRPQRYRGKVFGLIFSAIAFLFFAFFCYGIFYMLRQVPSSSGAPHVGQKAPDFILLDQNGKPVGLGDLLSGSRAVVLIFYRGFW